MSQTKAQLIDTLVASLLPASDSSVDIGSNGVRFANIYGDTLYGDGSNLTGITSTTINSNADNRLITGSGSANTLNGESELTYSSPQLKLLSTSAAPQIRINSDASDGSSTRLTIGRATGSNNFVNGSSAGDSAITFPSNLIFGVQTAEKIRIDSSGRLLIGTTTEGESTLDDLTISTAGDTGMTIRSGTSNNGAIGFSDGTSGADEYRGLIDYDHNGNYFRFYTNATERLRIDSSGRLLIGHTASRAVGGTHERTLQIEDVDAGASVSIARNSANSAGGFLSFGKSRTTSVGSNTIVQSGDTLGTISFAGADGTDMETRAADISGAVDGTPGSNDMPGRLVFSTTADGASGVSERMRIDSSGNVGIGITPESHHSTVTSLQIGGTTNLYDDSNFVILANNVYFDGTSNKRIKAEEASRITQEAGKFLFERAGADSADSAITFQRIIETTDVGTIFLKGEATSDNNRMQIRVDDTLATIMSSSNSSTERNIAFHTRNTGGSLAGTFTANGLAMPSGKGIDFSATGGPTNGTGSSELFDDYEEGSWTPSVATGTAGGVGNARYVKIGRVVHVEGGLSNFSDQSSSTAIEITGFPFALTFLENAKFTCSLSRVTQQATGQGAIVDMLHNTSTAFPGLQSNSASTGTSIRHQDLNHNAASIIFSGTYTTS